MTGQQRCLANSQVCRKEYVAFNSDEMQLIRLDNWLILSGNPQNFWSGLDISSSRTQELLDRCVLCPTRWTMRICSIKFFWITILNYWVFLNKFQRRSVVKVVLKAVALRNSCPHFPSKLLYMVFSRSEALTHSLQSLQVVTCQSWKYDWLVVLYPWWSGY
jgi:hypothetical protein